MNRSRFSLSIATILAIFVTIGCGKNSSKQPADKAMDIVDQFLEAWNRGESVDQFADPSRPLQGSDPDWKAGNQLMSFLSAGAKQSPDAPDRFRCRVALSLRNGKGRMWDQEVEYDVQLGEKSVVRRVSP